MLAENEYLGKVRRNTSIEWGRGFSQKQLEKSRYIYIYSYKQLYVEEQRYVAVSKNISNHNRATDHHGMGEGPAVLGIL
jgi:hypothetical protein